MNRTVITDSEMPQGSQMWRRWRRDCDMTATDAGDILRLYAPFKNAVRSWEEKRNPQPRGGGSFNPAIQHGKYCEPLARAAVNWALDRTVGGRDFEPVCIAGSLKGFRIGASLDGWLAHNGNAHSCERWLEIKCPYKGRRSKTYEFARNDEVDPLYLPQLAAQSLLVPGGECYFVVYIPDMFDQYTGEQVEEEYLSILTVGADLLEPYVEQLRLLAPMYMAGDPEPTHAQVPLIG